MRIENNQKGSTLIELLAAMAVGGLFLGILVPSIFQIIRHNDNNNTRITAVNQIENIARWLSKDGQTAQVTDLIEGSPANTLTLYWTDWSDWSGGDGYAKPGDFIEHYITYSLAGDELQRDYDGINTVIIAKYTSDIQFSLSGRIITVTVTSSPKGEDWPTESRTYSINLRPANQSPLYY